MRLNMSARFERLFWLVFPNLDVSHLSSVGVFPAYEYRVMQDRQILVVDDEDLFRMSVAEALGISCPGISVLQAANGAQALDILTTKSVCLMVMDLNMPIMDGFSLLAELSNRDMRLPIIVVTSCGGDNYRDRILGQGAIACLEKPINIDVLAEYVYDMAKFPEEKLSTVSIAGFAQLLEYEQRTCCLVVDSSEGIGQIYFRHGEVVHAQLGKQVGPNAFFHILQFNQRSFGVQSFFKHVDRTINASITELLLQATVVADEQSAQNNEHALTLKDDDFLRADESCPQQEIYMSTIEDALKKAMKISGAIAIAVVDYESGFALGKIGGTEYFDVETAAAGNTEVVRAKMRVMHQLDLGDTIDDILITLESQYHIIRPLRREKSLFLYAAIDRKQGNLAMARHQLRQLEESIHV
ncbi:MAG: response regulator [Myxococcales bacterium]|nr:response regulator [Myxococcales bacterium]